MRRAALVSIALTALVAVGAAWPATSARTSVRSPVTVLAATAARDIPCPIDRVAAFAPGDAQEALVAEGCGVRLVYVRRAPGDAAASGHRLTLVSRGPAAIRDEGPAKDLTSRRADIRATWEIFPVERAAR